MAGERGERMNSRIAVALLVGLGLAGTAVAEEHAGCPMRAAQVDHQHEGTTGVGNARSRHHFRLARDGGSIRLEAIDASDTGTRDRIRGHLEAIAAAFGKGDFAMPAAIHGAPPPGVAVLKERAADVRYAYAASPRGGVVTIATTDATALAAGHAFLRFQIADHATGDPTEPEE